MFKSRIAVSAAILLGAIASPASARDIFIPVDTSLFVEGDAYTVTSDKYGKADVKFEAFCDQNSKAAIKVSLVKTGHTNRPLVMIVESTHKGFSGKVGANTLDKARGSEASVMISSEKTVRPVGQATVFLHQLSNLNVEPVQFTFSRPHVNCGSIGGATYKDL